MLQNLHLFVEWLPTLQRICEELSPQHTHPDFRLYLASAPVPEFPVSVLENSVKICPEQPQGVRATIIRAHARVDPPLGPGLRQALMAGLALFHAAVRDRARFGPAGWTARYDFDDDDLALGATYVGLAAGQEAPLDVLKVLLKDVGYGGQVADAWDSRTVSFEQ